MDENKAEKLREIEYTIKGCCWMCQYGSFEDNQPWGTCDRHTYNHKKHTGGQKGSERNLSITRYGKCKHYVVDYFFVNDLDHFKEFHE